MFQNNYVVNKIQQDTYNDVVSELIPIIIEQYNPLVYKYENDEGKIYELELYIKSPRITYPKVCDNDGTINELTASLSRLRNYTYSSKLVVDMLIQTTVYKEKEVLNTNENLLAQIIIGKITIKTNSKYC